MKAPLGRNSFNDYIIDDGIIIFSRRIPKNVAGRRSRGAFGKEGGTGLLAHAEAAEDGVEQRVVAGDAQKPLQGIARPPQEARHDVLSYPV